LRKWKLRQRILVSFGIILALLVVMSTIAYSRLSAIEEGTRTLQGDPSLGDQSPQLYKKTLSHGSGWTYFNNIKVVLDQYDSVQQALPVPLANSKAAAVTFNALLPIRETDVRLIARGDDDHYRRDVAGDLYDIA
jgi:hypothetical protein